jgi:hypothetical protein
MRLIQNLIVFLFVTAFISTASAKTRDGHLYDDIDFLKSSSTPGERNMAEYYDDLYKESQEREIYRGVILISNDISKTLSKEERTSYIKNYNLDEKTKLGSILIAINPRDKTLSFIATGVISEKMLKDPNFFNAPIEKFNNAEEVKISMVIYFLGLLHLYLTGEYP